VKCRKASLFQASDGHCWTPEPEPWENASRESLETIPLRHSFQDANYHDRIVNEQKRAEQRGPCRPVRGNRSPEKRDRPQRFRKLADAPVGVKRPAESGREGGFSEGGEGINES
jgi:hypothetical protein